MLNYPLPQQSALPSEHGSFPRNRKKVQHGDVPVGGGKRFSSFWTPEYVL
jgi:hypothetical protein